MKFCLTDRDESFTATFTSEIFMDVLQGGRQGGGGVRGKRKIGTRTCQLEDT